MPESIFPLIVFDFGMSGASITTIIYVGHFLLNIPKGPFKKNQGCQLSGKAIYQQLRPPRPK